MQVYFTFEEYRLFRSGDKAVATFANGQTSAINIMQCEVIMELGAGRILVEKKV